MKLFGKEVSKKVKRDLIVRLIMIIISGGILVVFAFNSVAWFMQINKMTGTGMQIVIDAGTFEILVIRDTAPEYDRRTDPPEDEEIYSGMSALKEYYDSAEYVVNDNTYLDNEDNVFAWERKTDNDHTAVAFELINQLEDDEKHTYFLMPGAYGYVEFYIVPKSGAQESTKYKFDLSLGGMDYYYDSDEIEWKIREPQLAGIEDILKGHFLLFKGYNSLTEKYSALIADYDDIDDTDDIFTYDTTEHGGDWVSDIEGTGKSGYHVKFYWIWPMTYSDIINNISASGESNKKYPYELSLYLSTHPEYFFKIDEISLEGEVNDSRYNECDQLIGDYCDFLILNMEVVPDTD